LSGGNPVSFPEIVTPLLTTKKVILNCTIVTMMKNNLKFHSHMIDKLKFNPIMILTNKWRYIKNEEYIIH